MNKDKLIVKQQLEIEELKEIISNYKSACSDAYGHLNHPIQWSTKCPDFPKVAMRGIIMASQSIEGIL